MLLHVNFVLLNVRVTASTATVCNTYSTSSSVMYITETPLPVKLLDSKIIKSCIDLGKWRQLELPWLCQTYSLNIKTWNFLKQLFKIFINSCTSTTSYLTYSKQTCTCWLLTNLLLWHICISEIQFDISNTFSNTLNIHLCHSYIYPKLQKNNIPGITYNMKM